MEGSTLSSVRGFKCMMAYFKGAYRNKVTRLVCNVRSCVCMQLHGDGARDAFRQGLPSLLKVIYVLHANNNGVIQTPFSEEDSRLVDWVLVDGLQGGRWELKKLTCWIDSFANLLRLKL